MRDLVTIILIGIMFASCTYNEKKTEKNRKEQITEKQKLVINNLKEKYSIIYQWDTLRFEYSVDYKPIIESKYQIINHFEINDIYEKNDILFLSINTGYYHSFYFDFPITREQETFFKKIENNWSDNLILVVSINAINKIRFKIGTETEVDGDDNQSWINSWINLETSDDFFGMGEIIEIKPLTY